MPRTKPLRLLLGLRLRDPATEAAERAAEAFLEEITSLEPGLRLPLAWNLPLAPLESGRGRADLTVEIKTRVRSRSDSLLLMGYSGAPHPLLASEELDRELDWCRRNPWGTGAKALLGQEPRHLLPVCADLLRESQEGVYGRHGFVSVGLAEPLEYAMARFAAPGRAPFRFPARRRSGEAALYPAWVLPAGGGTRPIGRPEASIVLAAAAIAGRQPLFLLLEPAAQPGLLPGEEPVPLLAPLLQALAARFQPQFLTLEEALAGEAPTEIPGSPGVPDLLPLLSPAALEACSRAETLRARARRRTDADVRAVLEALGASESRPRAAARPREARRKPGPTLIAAMSGLVSLQGDGLIATFADGRISGLHRDKGPPPTGQPADSYLIAGGRRLGLETESAFSFEQGRDIGLRSVLKTALADGEARLEMQARFREGQEELELDLRLSFPKLPPDLRLEAVVPLELPVFALAHGEQASITGELPGGGSLAYTLTTETDEKLFTGSRLCLRKPGAPALVFTPGTSFGVLVLPVRVARSRRGLHLLASPFGARFPAPAGLYSDRTLSFNLRLGLEA
jgi:hypothetical protein